MVRRSTQVILALHNQLKNAAGLSYVSEYAYHSMDPWELVTKKKYPFFNVVPNDPSKRIEQVENLPVKDMKRHVYRIVVQYGVYSLDFTKTIMGDDATNFVGILDLQDDIYDAINADPTLGGAVRGLLPAFEPLPFDMVQDTEEEGFLAGGQIELEFYNDLTEA